MGLLLEHFGYYFSDEQYTANMATFLQYSFNWCADDEKIVNTGYHILRTIKSSIRRMDNQKAAELIICFFENHIGRFYRDVLQLAYYLDFTKVSDDYQTKLQNEYIALMRDNKFLDKDALQNAVITFRMNASISIQDIDDAVKSFMPEFYNNEYDLEFNKNNSKKHIDNYIAIVKKRNQEASASKYSSFTWNPFDIVRNIIEIDHVEFSDEEISDILSVIEETLVNKVQQSDQKNSAISLLLYLKGAFPQYPSWSKKVIFLDELWKLIGTAGNKLTAEFVLEILVSLTIPS